MSLPILTTREMCRIECGLPGNFHVDVESKSFLYVVKVVQKLESLRAWRTQLQVLPKSAASTTRAFDRGSVFVVAQSLQPQLLPLTVQGEAWNLKVFFDRYSVMSHFGINREVPLLLGGISTCPT